MNKTNKNFFETKNLLKIFSGSFVIRITYTLLGFANTVLLAKVLGVNNYGIYVFCLSIVALLSVPTQLGMPTLILREFSKYQVQNKWALFKGIEIRSQQFVIVMSGVTCCLTAVFLYVNPFSIESMKLNALLISLFLIPILSLSALRAGMLKGLRYVVWGQLPENVIRPVLLLSGLFFLVMYDIEITKVSSILLLYLGSAIVAFIFGYIVYRQYRPKELHIVEAKFNNKYWIISAFPIGLTMAMQTLNFQLSSVALGFFSESENIAYYRVAALIAGFVVITLQIVNSVVAPYFSRYFAQNDIKSIEKLVGKVNWLIVTITLPIVVLIILFGKAFLVQFYGSEFENAYVPLVILTLGQAVNALSGSVGLLLNMTGYQKIVSKIVSGMLVVNVLLHLLLVPSYGVVGAAVASTFVIMLMNIILWVTVKRKLKIKYFI